MKRFIAIWILVSAGLNIWQMDRIRDLEEKRPMVIYKADNAGAEIFGKVVDWVDNQVDFAEAMSLPANKKVLDIMMEKNAEAWAEIADMLENRELIYKMKKG